MLAENSAEQGGGRRNPDGFRGRQRSYAEFNATDVKGFYWILVLYAKTGAGNRMPAPNFYLLLFLDLKRDHIRLVAYIEAVARV